MYYFQKTIYIYIYIYELKEVYYLYSNISPSCSCHNLIHYIDCTVTYIMTHQITLLHTNKIDLCLLLPFQYAFRKHIFDCCVLQWVCVVIHTQRISQKSFRKHINYVFISLHENHLQGVR